MIQKPAMLLLQYSCLSEAPNKNTFHYFNTGVATAGEKEEQRMRWFHCGFEWQVFGWGAGGGHPPVTF